ncbi:MAG: CARDB domain-containing protein [Candidatus Electrothrix scaldis]|nr:MAG: CARDB domain-containing protein [Candidatus Electrothrix sp. GW3-3]
MYDFWRKADPIYASNQSGENNFDAQFKVENNSSSSSTVDDMAIAILKDGSFLFDCWLKGSSTTISAGSSYQTGIKYCEIYNSGSYSAEARLKIKGQWGTYGSHSFTVLDKPSGVGVYDFWRRADPIYASNQSGEDNFDAQFRVQNNESSSVTINNMAIAVLKDGAFLFDCWLKDSPTTISGNSTYSTDIKYCEIWNSGSYSVEARLQMGEDWGTYGSHSFTVYDQQTSFPDLIVQSPSVDDNTLSPSEDFKVFATVRNAGSGSSDATTLRYYLSTNSTISTSDSEIGTDTVDPLSAGASSPEDKSGREAPPSPGTYWVGACVDAVSGESNTGNNCSAGVQITVADDPPVSQEPVGYFDSADCNGFSGWTKDPDTTAPIDVHFYADGPAGTGAFIGSASANIYRGDLPYSDKNHGFSFATPESLKDGQSHQIYVYALDDQGGTNSLLTNSPKSIQCTPVNQPPVGIFESAGCSTFSGWTKDPDTTNPISVHFYVDGPAGTGTFIGGISADVYRGDLPYEDKNHGFSFAFPDSLNDGVEHQVYAYAIDSGGGNNPLLTNSPKTAQCGLTADQLAAVMSVIENVLLSEESSSPVDERKIGWLPAIFKILLLTN